MVKVATPQRKKESVWTQGKRKDGILRTLPQVQNRVSVPRDAARKAREPGLRISRNGKKYWETRANRSDKRGSNL